MKNEITTDERADKAAFLDRLGERVRLLRTERHLSQEEAALEANIMQHYWSQVELGQRNPSIAVVRQMARVLGVSLQTLLDHLD